MLYFSCDQLIRVSFKRGLTVTSTRFHFCSQHYWFDLQQEDLFTSTIPHLVSCIFTRLYKSMYLFFFASRGRVGGGAYRFLWVWSISGESAGKTFGRTDNNKPITPGNRKHNRDKVYTRMRMRSGSCPSFHWNFLLSLCFYSILSRVKLVFNIACV